jgi:hypothetical protein
MQDNKELPKTDRADVGTRRCKASLGLAGEAKRLVFMAGCKGEQWKQPLRLGL